MTQFPRKLWDCEIEPFYVFLGEFAKVWDPYDMGYEPEAVEEEDGNDDVGYSRGFGLLEVPVKAKVPVDYVAD